jgi:hypothetical protein
VIIRREDVTDGTWNYFVDCAQSDGVIPVDVKSEDVEEIEVSIVEAEYTKG